MENNIIELNWFGPFKWFDNNGYSIFDQKEAKDCGLYIWAAKKDDAYLIYYVGETGRSFIDRFTEHISCYLSGLYRTFDADEFSKGIRKKIIWQGMWSKDSKYKMNDFLLTFPDIYQNILSYLSNMHIFISPYDLNKRIRKRIEGGIAKELRENVLSKDFLDELTRYSFKWVGEDNYSVKLNFPSKIIGLENNLIEI